LRARETGDVADLRGDGEAEQLADPGDAHQQLHARVGARDGTQLTLEHPELGVEVVDDRQQRGDRLKPHRRHPVLGELAKRVGLAQGGEVAPQPPLREQPEAAVAASPRA
jgi:hypothetical protein